MHKTRKYFARRKTLILIFILVSGSYFQSDQKYFNFARLPMLVLKPLFEVNFKITVLPKNFYIEWKIANKQFKHRNTLYF